MPTQDTRFSGVGDTTPTHYGEPVPYGDFYAAATGADEELTAERDRHRDDRIKLVLEFDRDADREKFVTTLLLQEFEKNAKHPPIWRLVKLWSLGEGSL